MSKQDLINRALQLQSSIASQRRTERNIQSNEKSNTVLFSQPSVKKNALESHLEGILPPGLIPSNVGDINNVQWGFFYEVDFDFGTNPTFDTDVSQTKQFKVNNEAAFLLTRIYRTTNDAEQAGFEAPLTMTLRDNQSSRQLMSQGIPLQAIPSRGYYYELPVPFLIYPAASMSIELNCWLPAGVSLPTTGAGQQNFTFYGAKVRVQSVESVLKAMFQDRNG